MRTARRFTLMSAAAALAVGALATATAPRAASPKFYDDDPVWREVDTQDASGVQEHSLNLLYENLSNLFATPGDNVRGVRAQNVNTVDEVPDSAWFTNRAGHRPLTVDEVVRASNTSAGPAPGQWTIVSAKSDGVTPGFTIRDTAGDTWFLKFDPPGYRGMATGSEVIVTKIFWALGYHVPENHIAHLRSDDLVIDDEATIRPLGGARRRALKPADIEALLRRADKDEDGTYRVVASKALPGKPVGGFMFHDVRPDDPNDVVRHEHRRELRGYRAFAAWTQHVDAKATNTLDTLVTENGRTVVKHHLIDFGSTLGSGAVHPREPFEGTEYVVEPGEVGKNIIAFGFRIAPWRTVPLYESTEVGRIWANHEGWDPHLWKSRTPNSAHLRARHDDLFWAATKMRAIDDEMIRAIVRTAEWRDERNYEAITRFLLERRSAILQAFLTDSNPVSSPALAADGTLTFENLAVSSGVAPAPEGYRIAWLRFDNAANDATPIAETTTGDTRAAAPQGLPTGAGQYVLAQIAAVGGPNPQWEKPVHAFFRRQADGWKLVGFERQPEGEGASPLFIRRRPVRPARR
jgi:hypothetical protein